MKIKLAFRLALAGAAVALGSLAHAQPAPSGVIMSGPAGQVTLAELEMMAKEMIRPDQRAAFWSQPESIERLARSIYAQRAVAQTAVKEGLDKAGDGPVYLKLMRERALTELTMQQRVRAKTPSDKTLDDLAQGEYKAKPERFAEPEQAHVRHILLGTAPDGSNDAQVKAKGEALLAELRKGADFAKLAQENSDDKGSAARGGDLGFVQAGRTVPEFEQAAFALKNKGDLSGLVKTKYGYHIIELVEHKPAGTASLQEALPALREEMLAKINNDERLKTWQEAEDAGKVNADEVARVVKAHGGGK
jgi:peptidyl-prolyl cis-trans isomerase C